MKFCVIGLGRFGYRLATTLADNGMEVMGIDKDESIVASIKDKVTQAVCLHIEDEESLLSVGIEEMDIVIVGVGENFAESILITALLKKLEISRIITRAVTEIQKDILKLIGANQIVLPEQEIGIKLADNLSAPYSQLLRLTKEFGIGQVLAPSKFIEKSIQDLNIFEKYNVHCIGLKKDEKIIPIGADYIVQSGDRLVCAGNIEKLVLIAQL